MIGGQKTWVVYKKLSEPHGANAVCEQAEWEQMRRRSPGHYALIHAGISSEPTAERIAREGPRAAAAQVAIPARF